MTTVRINMMMIVIMIMIVIMSSNRLCTSWAWVHWEELYKTWHHFATHQNWTWTVVVQFFHNNWGNVSTNCTMISLCPILAYCPVLYNSTMRKWGQNYIYLEQVKTISADVGESCEGRGIVDSSEIFFLQYFFKDKEKKRCICI